MNFFQMSEWVTYNNELNESITLPLSGDALKRSNLSSEDNLEQIKSLFPPAMRDMIDRATQGLSGRDAYMAARQAVQSIPGGEEMWRRVVDRDDLKKKAPAPPPAPKSGADVYGKLKNPLMPEPPPPPPRR